MSEKNSQQNEQWQLVATGDWLAGQVFTMKPHNILGRDPSCDIIIPGTHLSRRHAELAIHGRSLLVRDLGSANGTYVNERRIEQAELKPGDRVRFDVLTFTVSGPNVSEQPVSQNRSVTQIRKIDEAVQTAPAPSSSSASDKQWKTKPTSVGNREKTIQMSAAKKAANHASMLIVTALTLATIAAIGYLITQL